MSQATLVIPTTGPLGMAGVAALINSAMAAVQTNFAGTVAPSTTGYPATYQFWMDTGFTPARLKVYDSSTWPIVGMLDAVNHQFAHSAPPIQASTANRTGVITDANKLIEMNSTAVNGYSIPSSTTVVFPSQTEFSIVQKGVGVTSIVPLTTSMTINGTTLTQNITKRYGRARVYLSSADSWIASGDIST